MKLKKFLDTICDECIVFDTKNYFAEPTILDDLTLVPTILENIKISLYTNYKKIYQYFGF